ncbi:MAG: alpha/beta hydrolase [Oricola sp.]
MLHARNRIAKGLVTYCGTRWPDATAAFAFRAFTRTARKGGKARSGGMPQGSQPTRLQTGSGIVAAWHMPAAQPTGRKALLVHGWNSRSAHMLAIAKSLNAAGVDAVLIDLPGHGASTGRHLHLGKGIEAVDAAWRNYGPFETFVGHSFGGAVALNAALGSSMCIPARRPDNLVMIASPNSMPSFFRLFGRVAGLPKATQEAFERKVLTLLGQSLDCLVASEQLKDYQRPVLVVHDMDDTDVLYADALRIAQAGAHVSLRTTSGLGHRRILKDPGVLADICRVAAGAEPRASAAVRPVALAGTFA